LESNVHQDFASMKLATPAQLLMAFSKTFVDLSLDSNSWPSLERALHRS